MFAGLDKSVQIGMSMDPSNYVDNRAEVIFGGLSGSMVVDAEQAATIDFSMEHLRAREFGTSNSFQIAGIKLESSTEGLNDILAPTVAMLAIPAIDSNGAVPFNISEISADYRLSPSPAGPQQVDMYQKISVASIDSDLPLGSFHWTSEMNEVSSELVRGYYNFLPAMQGQLGSNSSQMSQFGQDMAMEAIKNSLVMNNEILANVYDGDHSVDLLIDWEGLPQLADISALDINEALAALTVELTVSMDETAIMTSPAALELVDPYLQQGFLEVENGRIMLVATLRDSELVVNGDVVPLDQFF